MPWKQKSTKMELRLEFVTLAMRESANISALCRRFGISRTTGYKWIRRYKADGKEGLKDRSRRPHSSPTKTSDPVEEAVCAVRRQHPGWGGRKIRKVLQRKAEANKAPFDEAKVPAASTCTRILHRRDLIREEDAEKSASYERFEKERPNQLWQMDFKGDFLLDDENRCYPLTVVDDHSRFAVVLEACPNQQHETVKSHLTKAFRRYGLPERIITDRGAPWGVGMEREDGGPFYTGLSAWLMRLGIQVSFTARCHPETNGKNERFNGTLQAEVLRFEHFADLEACRGRFKDWRRIYNCERPHEGIGMEVPAGRYQVSDRTYPQEPPPVEYGPGEEVRQVNPNGQISFRSRRFKVGKAFGGHPVALRPTTTEGEWEVYFCHQKIRTLNLEASVR